MIFHILCGVIEWWTKKTFLGSIDGFKYILVTQQLGHLGTQLR